MIGLRRVRLSRYHGSMRRRLLAAVFATLTFAALTALTAPGQATAAERTATPGPVTIAHGVFGPYVEGRPAVTYDPGLVPEGAKAGVFAVSMPGLGTSTKLVVSGLVSDRHYGAHVHTRPCGPTGDDAGPHFQHVPDPVSPSTDPAYANPENEIWLDFTTSAAGTGFALSHVDWPFASHPERRPASVVLHEHHTATAPGEAGSAGARLACLDVRF